LCIGSSKNLTPCTEVKNPRPCCISVNYVLLPDATVPSTTMLRKQKGIWR